MSDLAICARGLGKRYRLYQDPARPTYRTVRDDLLSISRQWLARLRRRELLEDQVWALRNASFDVYPGEILGLIGRNGAGKSTLLKILGRIVAPTTGEVDIYGRVGSLLEVGTGFHPELTGRENIYLSGALLGMRRHEVKARFDEIVAFSETEKIIDTPCGLYPTGMTLRLGFAVAAHLNADILLVDEVLAVGDIAFQKKCLKRMSDVAKDGRAVLFVSHNLAAVRSVCSSLIVVRKGKVETKTTALSDTISNYVSATGSSNAIWKAPSDEPSHPWFSLKEMKVTNSEGRMVTAPRHPDDETFIEISGVLSEAAPPTLSIGFGVYAEDQRVLFRSFQTDPAEGHDIPLVPGENCVRAKLPAALFNEGRYRIDFIVALNSPEWLERPNPGAPTVEFQIEGFTINASPYIVRRPGALSPILEWDRGPS